MLHILLRLRVVYASPVGDPDIVVEKDDSVERRLGPLDLVILRADDNHPRLLALVDRFGDRLRGESLYAIHIVLIRLLGRQLDDRSRVICARLIDGHD